MTLRRFGGAIRGASPVIGVVLMVAITVVLAATIGVMALGFGDIGDRQTVETAVDLESTNAGTELTPAVIGQTVDVRLNDRTLATLDVGSAGESVFLPTAPGDEVTLVAEGDESSILVRESFDAGEAGDFVVYYSFDGSGEDVDDRSLHGNHGERHGDGDGPERIDTQRGTALEFDGESQYVDVDELKTGDVDVETFTVAVTFELAATGEIQQLVEHNNEDEEWHLETTENDGLQFALDWDDHVIKTDDDAVDEGETYTAVGTYDGTTYRLYLDGELVAENTHDTAVDMGRMRLGKDDSHDSQHLNGKMYEFRLYHTALDETEVEMLTRVMD